MRLKDKVAIVTGASSRGIGRAIAIRFAREGAEVAIVGRRREKLEEAAVEITREGKAPLVIDTDVSVPENARTIADKTIAHFGKLDILVNNAATIVRKPFTEVEPDEFDRVFATNVRGYFFCAQGAARHMIKQNKGKIVIVSSDIALRGIPFLSAYAASKGATHSLTKTLAKELMPHHINVNAIVPGTVETDINRHKVSDPEWREAAIARCPMGIGSVDDIAPAAVYLASKETDWMTGQAIIIDGGHLT